MNIPLSSIQKNYWFDRNIESSDTFYSIPCTIEIEGSLEIEIFKKSLQIIVERQAMLRTIFLYQDGTVIQEIQENGTIELNLKDLEHLPNEERKHTAYQLLKEEAQQPFKMLGEYLVRFSLYQLSTTSYIFMFNMHHIVCDGWSIKVFRQKLATIYNSLVEGDPNPLPPLPMQYADFVAEEQQWLRGDEAQKAREYWRKQLANLPVMNLPYDRPEGLTSTYGKAKAINLKIDSSSTQQLKHFCSTHRITLYMLFLAIWQLLLGYYGGQTDVVVGSLIAGRSRFETESIIGIFANSVLVRIQYDLNSTFEEFLLQVRRNCLANFTHQNIPVREMAVELKTIENTESNLCRVLFSMDQYFQTNNVEMIGLKTKKGEGIGNMLMRYALEINVKHPEKDILYLNLFYRSDLFDVSTITQIASKFGQLLDEVVNYPEETLDELLCACDLEHPAFVAQD